MQNYPKRNWLTYTIFPTNKTQILLIGGLIFLFFFLFLNTKGALADSCPCCGNTYDAPMPGDEARVYQIRRAHEASCCRKPSSTPSYQQPSVDRGAERRRQQELERQRREAEERRRRLKRAEEEARQREQARRRQFELDKQDALKMLKSGAGQLGLKSGAGSGLGLKGVSGSDLKLKGITPTRPAFKEPLFSKGTKSSAPVDLQSMDPDKPPTTSPKKVKGKADSRKGLRTNYVPKPALPSLADYHYEKKSRTDIVLDALEVGKNDFGKSIRHLEKYLAEVHPDNLKVQEALSYIQGMAEGDFLRKKMKKKTGPFDPTPEDSSALLEAVSGKPRRIWPGPTINPDQIVPMANPLKWKSVRDTAIAEAVESLPKDTEKLTRDDLQKCIQSLEKQMRKNPDVNGYSQARQFFEGVITYY